MTTFPRAGDRSRRRAGVALLLSALLLLALGLPLAPTVARGVGAAGHANIEFGRMTPAAAPVLEFVNMTDTPRFLPSSITGIHAGSAVTVHLENQGSFPHTFTLVNRAGLTLNTSWTPAQLDSFFRLNGSLANVSVAPGAVGWANFTLPANASGGSFEFVSVVPFQFQAGMSGTILVSAGAPAATLTDQATAGLSFVPNQLVVNATSYPITIGITVTNVGSLIHTWTLNPFANVLLTPGNFSSFFSSHAPAVDLLVTNPGEAVNGTFIISSPGVYQFLCTEPGHFAAGMDGLLYVGVPAPSPVAPPSTALVQVGILAGAGALVGVATIVAFAGNFVGRFPPRAPPHP